MPPSRSPVPLLIVVAALAAGVFSTAGTAGGPVHALAAASSPVVATAPPDPVPATASPAPTPQATGPIVALGDSLTYGYGTGVTAQFFGPAPAHSYPWDMERDLGIPVVNAGISGTTAAEVLDPVSAPEPRPVALRLPALLALHPRLMVVAFGTNEAANYGWSIARTVASFHVLLARIAAAGVPIVLVGTHVDCTAEPCGGSERAAGAHPAVYTTAWDAALSALAAEYGAGLVLDVQRGLTAADMTDWIHCDAQGYRLMAARIEAAVRARLG
ncbi:MAG TPA: GDSL-type esterase/lipase family protein [Candidatus Dormibacteraeota bacterium]